MRKQLMAMLAGAMLLGMNLAVVGCGEPEVPQETADAGINETDGGSDAGVIEDEPADTVLTLTRFNADGTVDTSYGEGGTAKIDLETNAGNTRETLWAADLDAEGRVVLFGNKKAPGERTDADRYVVRVTTEGKLDETFADNGVFSYDEDGLNDQARNGFVQADGKILAAGYVNAPTGVGEQTANKIVLLRLNADGTLDSTFGEGGVAEANPFSHDDGTTPWGMAEAYAAGQQSNGSYVTSGYGREASSGKVDLVSFRFGEDGTLDESWNVTGKQVIDIAGDDDRGRNLVVMPNDHVMLFGSGKPTASNLDAMVVVLKPDGTFQEEFAAGGRKLYDFGRPDEAFFAAATDDNFVVAAGYRAGAAAGVAEDDDAILFIYSDDGTEFAEAVPFSETENDRIWGVALDADSKILATGFVGKGEDTQTLLARFNPDGSLDTSFGNEGVVVLNLVEAGSLETGRAVVVQADGKIVVAGLAEKK